MKKIRFLAVAFVAVLLPQLVSAQMAKSSGPSLYQRIGGYDAVTAVADDFLGRLITEPKLAKFFGGVSDDSKVRLRQHVVEFVCLATGGPCAYTGRDMRTAHKGLGISDEDFNVAAGHFFATLEKFKVKQAEKEELIAAITSVKPASVEKQ